MSQRNRWVVAGIIAAAWLVRVALLVPLHDSYYQSGLSLMHDDAAHNLLRGEGLVSHPEPWLPFAMEQLRQEKVIDGERLRAMPHERGPAYPYIAYMPGYPMLLALTYWVTGVERYWPIQLVQVTLDAATCGVLAWLGLRLFSRRVGLAAAAAYALYLPSVRLSVVPLPDALVPFLITAGLACWVQATRGDSRRWAGACGLLLGSAVLMRPDVVLLPLVLAAVWVVLQGWARARMWVLSSLMAFGLIMAPWVIRNVVVFRMPILTKAGPAIGLLELLGKYDPTGKIPDGDVVLAQREGYNNLYYPDGFARDTRRFEEAVAVIRQRPLWYAGLVFRQIPRLFFRNFFGILPGPEWSELREQGYSITRYLREFPGAATLRMLRRLSGIMEWLLVLGAAVGIGALWRAKRRQALLITSAIPVYYVVVHIPMFTVARYFLPAVPCLLLLSVVGWMALLRIRWAA